VTIFDRYLHVQCTGGRHLDTLLLWCSSQRFADSPGGCRVSFNLVASEYTESSMSHRPDSSVFICLVHCYKGVE
jgi:hypothetical protein